MFNTILSDGITPVAFAACIATSLVLGLIVAGVHLKTSHTTKNFLTTLAILPTLVAMVILLVNGNLGASVATIGAFSLVRFRSIPGNSRAIMDVFFAMAIGLAVGTGYLGFAALFTAIVAVAIFILHKVKFGSSTLRDNRLTILVPEELDYTNLFDDVFTKYTKTHNLEKSKTTNMGSLFELAYRVQLKNGVNEKDFIDAIRVKNGNLKVALSHNLNEEEL